MNSGRTTGLKRRGGLEAAFSLVELLVVIAILGILSSVLLPALVGARESARKASCLTNARQLALAAQMYWDDNGGAAFRYRGIATNGGDIYWFGWLERGAEGARKFDPSPGALQPYLIGRGIQLCPSLDYSFGKFKLKAAGASYGYGYNIHLSAPASQPAFSVTRLVSPGQTVLFGDAAQVNDFQLPASPENPMLEEFYYVGKEEATVHFRHRKLANAAFCDGHAAPEPMAAGSLDTRLPTQNVGKLRPEVFVTW